MSTRNRNLCKCFYQTNLNIAKHYVWQNPYFAFKLLDQVTKLVIDQLVNDFFKQKMIPMQLIQIYERIERSLKHKAPLKLRLHNYAMHSARLYDYIERNLGKGQGQLLFEQACKRVTHPKYLAPH